jgi:hypothetical protein
LNLYRFIDFDTDKPIIPTGFQSKSSKNLKFELESILVIFTVFGDPVTIFETLVVLRNRRQVARVAASWRLRAEAHGLTRRLRAPVSPSIHTTHLVHPAGSP